MAYKDLTEADKEEIRSLLAQKIQQTTIAERFGINQSDVSRIKNNKVYEKYSHLYITGVSKKTRSVLETIAANRDMKFASFMRMAINEIIDSTPEKYKRPVD